MSKRFLSGHFLTGLIFLALLIFQTDGRASHLRAGNIFVQRVSCSALTFRIIITAYTNEGSSVRFSNQGSGTVNFGDNSPVYHPPQNDGMQVPNYSNQFFYVVDTILHTYSGSGKFIVSYLEDNRNGGILNMFDSFDTPFYIDTEITIDPLLGCDNSPVLTVPPIDQACTGVKWLHNPGAYDPDKGDSLSYVLVVPKQNVGTDVADYHDPNNQAFYAGIGKGYNLDNQANNGPPTFAIDAITGTITWDSPGERGEYNIAFHVIEWRKINGVWVQLGYVTRDMQIIVNDCTNKPPVLHTPADTCVVAGTKIVKSIYAIDPDNNQVRVEAFSQVFSLNPSPATMKPAVPSFLPSGTPSVFTWQTTCDHVKEQPYQVVFKATDQPNPDTGPALVDFKTWNITVVGPAPTWLSLTPVANHQANLQWDVYDCAKQATTMQIWRRVESNPYTPPACVTGMPPGLGYTMIDIVPIGTTQYVDTNNGKGLAAGAQYCYRLVAVFAAPGGGLSIVSKESCFTTLRDAPIITHVTIDKTDASVGEDTIKWVAPLKSDLNATLYPPPYTYSVFRADGFTANAPLVAVTPGKIDTTFVIDSNIDTENNPYNYRVVGFASNGATIDTSAVASSVQLTLKPSGTSIDLTWNAVVPWSNILPAHKFHSVYRGPDGSTKPSDLELIATVDVTQQNFHYTDNGPLDNTKKYCYAVKTEGGYGNPSIPEPFANFSQISCILPSDNAPPCAVVINAKGTDCSTQGCATTTFSNILSWNRPTSTCQEQPASYNIYSASQTNGLFAIRALAVTDTFFVDNNLASYAQCYKVSAVSRSGIESALSNAFCFDNCPNYELPNVFTPNDDDCNNVFSAYSNRGKPEGSTCQSTLDVTKCARFVNSVKFIVCNRWGKEVYTYESGGENTIYIDWNGKDDGGKDLASGIYYYVAEVNFNVVDPKQQNKNIKGWVQILR